MRLFTVIFLYFSRINIRDTLDKFNKENIILVLYRNPNIPVGQEYV